VVQNYGGDTKSPTVPQLYDRSLGGEANPAWDFTRWTPHVVVVDLGTNDYSTAGAQPDSAKFFRTYLAFVDSLHAKYPQAKIVLVDGPMMSDGYPAGLNTLTKLRNHLKAIVVDATKRGIQVTHLSLTPQDDTRGYGADYHPNRAQARLNGSELAAHLRQVMPEWKAASTNPGSTSPRTGMVSVAITGWELRNDATTEIQASLRDARGSLVWTAHLAPGSRMSLPGSRSIRWMQVDADQETRVFPVPPDLR